MGPLIGGASRVAALAVVLASMLMTGEACPAQVVLIGTASGGEPVDATMASPSAVVKNGRLTLALFVERGVTATSWPFHAEVFAPPSTEARIRSVEYLIGPAGSAHTRTATDRASRFRITGLASGETPIAARVWLSPAGRGGAKQLVVLEGRIPSPLGATAAASPQPPGPPPLGASAAPAPASGLPAGLSFGVRFQPAVNEGASAVEYVFAVRLEGDAGALDQVASVEYHLPREHFSIPIVVARRYNGFLIDGTAPAGSWYILVRVRLKSGARIEHRIPFRKP